MQKFIGIVVSALLVFGAFAALELPTSFLIAAVIIVAPILAKLIMSLATRTLSRRVSATRRQPADSERKQSSTRS